MRTRSLNGTFRLPALKIFSLYQQQQQHAMKPDACICTFHRTQHTHTHWVTFEFRTPIKRSFSSHYFTFSFRFVYSFHVLTVFCQKKWEIAFRQVDASATSVHSLHIADLVYHQIFLLLPYISCISWPFSGVDSSEVHNLFISRNHWACDKWYMHIYTVFSEWAQGWQWRKFDKKRKKNCRLLRHICVLDAARFSPTYRQYANSSHQFNKIKNMEREKENLCEGCVMCANFHQFHSRTERAMIFKYESIKFGSVSFWREELLIFTEKICMQLMNTYHRAIVRLCAWRR